MPKSEASVRSVALDAGTLDMVKPLLVGREPDEFLFTHPVTGAHWRPGTFNPREWYPARARAKEAGLTRSYRFHDLRHTHAAWLLTSGIQLLAVSRRLGHENINVTAGHYAHLMPEADDAIRKVLDRLRSV